MSDVSEESLLDYFYSTGGKVKNADLLKAFKPFIGHSDLELRAKYREEFKLIIDRIAVVKSENGEKYLFLKKKYRQLLHDRDAEHHGTAGGGQSPLPPASLQWEGSELQDGSDQVVSDRAATESISHPQEALQTGADFIHPSLLEPPMNPIQDASGQSNEEDEQDKVSGSKSESEQDEEGSGSMGSTAVALDPIEKEWIYSAAGARVHDLSQLLRQDPTLANKKDFTSGFTALHWAAKHGNVDMATLVANAGTDVNIKSHGYTPLHIAALHGHLHILDLLTGTYGAKENLRDYSGHLACHYLTTKEPRGPDESSELQFQVSQARERHRNRKLASLFQSKKKWGSAEELAPIEEDRTASNQLLLPAFRPRKFSR
ncbi:ankyrin repeat domain-containing protein SOWAHB isoform X2 [Thalassophryne amazonica]|uniref:ankyrin repeat domain-containing protein SOWAHB isoform X2 n=1 Tax=Thalassophryne amazonica TaxID=390379 RepID=UPI001470B865|nr:ankyrin repeat domain-containing protein SOWAHB isoform X2 [Thalassophryne amazonica]